MDVVRLSVRQPVTIAVGVILVLLAGTLALGRLPIQLTPNVEDTIVAVTTLWEGASPREIEQEIIDPQEEKLQSISGLRTMTSVSNQGQGIIRLQFVVGTPKDAALRQVSDKLREVPAYPARADEPVVEASDPESQDFIAWIAFRCTDKSIDVRTLGDFVRDRVQPQLERVRGISEVNVLGGREREVRVRVDPVRLANRGVTLSQLAAALGARNRNVSGGEVEDGKLDVRLRTVGQYETLEAIEDTVIRHVGGAPVLVRDVGEAVQTFKEPTTFVRSLGEPVVIMNADREVGTNLMEVMDRFKARIAELNAEGGMLTGAAQQLGINGRLYLEQVYDQTVYIRDALDLVESNIWIGGGLAMFVLLLFLRSVRSLGIIGLSIPVSIVGAAVAMVAMGRSVNVISLAGMAFAVGMVVDNSIVVLENVFRHLELGKSPAKAAYDGAREVWLAVLASTLTTIVVFVPVLLIEEEAGQLFRDIALAICATVGISMLVAVTVIPSAAARFLRPARTAGAAVEAARPRGWVAVLGAPWFLARRAGRALHEFPVDLANLIRRLNRSVSARLGLVLGLSAASAFGSLALVPPADYLPAGNRNLVLGIVITPPGYNLDQKTAMAERIEAGVRPFFEAGRLQDPGEYAAARARLPQVPTFDWTTFRPGPPVVPPPLSNYFLVAFEGTLFQGGVAREPERVADLAPLFQHATRAEVTPGVLAFAFQLPLFRLGGRTGAAVKIDFTGDDLDLVARSASAAYLRLMQRFGPETIQPLPANFDIPGPELQFVPDDVRLAEAGLSPTDLGLAVQAAGDGALVGDYLIGGQTIDVTLVSRRDHAEAALDSIASIPVATPGGRVVPLDSVSRLVRTTSPPAISRVDRQRAVTLQFTPPRGVALEAAIGEIDAMLKDLRASGGLPAGVDAQYTGSASKLQNVQRALLGDGSLTGTVASSLFIAVAVVYLLMCVLFQSFVYPLVILFSVPLATLGGFASLALVHSWSATDRYMPVQMLDVLTMLGFIILIGVVVNNAILIVHQTLHNRRGFDGAPPMPAGEAIAEAVRSRVRPIFMSMLTSVGGMLPLVLMPGSGSELYRGLGSVVVGGLFVSTVFTLVLVPLLLSLVMDVRERLVRDEVRE